MIAKQVEISRAESTLPGRVGRTRSQRARFVLSRYRLGMVGAILLILIIGCAVFAPILAPADPDVQNMDALLVGPSLDHPLGTDDLGRDVLSRLLYGARVSLLVGLVATAVATSIGVLLGLASGFIGGWLDSLIMRGVDIIFAFPTLVLAVAIVGALGPSLVNATIAVTIVTIPRFARLIRGEVLKLREYDYVIAAVTVGANSKRIIMRHIFPNTLGLIAVQFSLSIATAILNEASLSFLGLGVQPPTPSWGSMLKQGYPFLDMAVWLSMAPGFAITLTVLAFTFLGDAIRDYVDPRLRQR